MANEPEEKPLISQEIPNVLPLLPVRDLVVFPYMIAPLRVTRPISLDAVNAALETEERLIFIVAQRESGDEDPKPSALYKVGTVGVIMRMRRLSDGGLKILVQGLCRARVQRVLSEQPSYRVRLDLEEEPSSPPSVEVEGLARTVRHNVERIAELGRTLQPELAMVLQNVDDAGRMADLVASNLTLKLTEAQALLETADPVERLTKVNQGLENEIGILEVQNRIQNRAKEEMSKTQRDYFLREQLRQIRQELGDADSQRDELDDLKQKIEKVGLSTEARSEADKQLRRLEQMSPESAEAAVVRSYLEVLLELPWKDVPSEEIVDLKTARKVLDEDHYDLEHIKERILDFLAVHKLRSGAHGPILCFMGPPGVGKTSLGRSIARSLGRKFVRISLGGVRDEAEIRGHRRTYVGAMPGRILQGMKQAGTRNPVFLLDELDKMGADFRGDPSAALLEVLDPEQNHTFRDHYLGVPFDLSKVMFIATANMIDGIPPPLHDRMETLRLAGYSEEEKLAIAEKYLLPKQIAEAGLQPKDLLMGKNVLRKIVSEYTREAGLRELERQIAQLARKLARRVVEGAGSKTRMRRTKGALAVVTANDLPEYLGPVRFLPDEKREADEVGIANGLAWTQYGGEVLTIEAQIMAGKGSLTLTGQLGDVMKESAQAALSFARAHALALGLRGDFFADREIHIHVPAGGVPKDGPSAGITMASVLVSLASGIPVRRDVCMTGELTLRGRVLPIGGLKEKLLAAVRAGMKMAIIPAANVGDLSEIPEHLRAKIRVQPVRVMAEVLPLVLTRPLPAPGSAAAIARAKPVTTTPGRA